MALNNSEKDSSTPSNGSSSSKSDKASAPSPSSPSFSGDSDSPQSAPSKSPPPPPSKSTPPPPSQSTPPPPSHSPPPPPSHSPPPPTSQSPPPSPSHSPPPPPPPSPSHSTPPPLSSPPSKGSAPPPTPSSSSSSSPPPPPSSTPPPPPPSPNGNSPPQQSPPSQSQAPPPPDKSSPPPTPTPPSPASPVTPPATKSPISPVPPTGSGSGSNHPPPSQSPAMSAGSHTKPSGPSKSSTPGGAGDNTGEYVGYSLAGVFVVALVAVVLFFIFRKKKKRGNLYAAPYMPPPNNFNMKPDMHYYVEQPGIANGPQDGFYSSQPAHSPLGNNYGNGNHGGTMHRLSTPSDSAQPKGGQIVFSYDKVMEITNGFSSQNVIGEGGFGCVYKASLPDGRVGAVKMLKAGSGQGEREFRAEVEIISRVHHRHLVSLVGYCISEQQRVLIYEFVPNGTLDHHLHGSGLPVLDWPKRMKIAIGAAKGLAYLHDDCNPKIIHRDIKSANILLDDAYEAQVSDFGLARLTDDANTHVSTRVMGTFGYMAPEYATSGKLTDRSDVFSFGVVLLELVTGRKPVDQTQPVGDESLVEWARPLLLRAIETGDFGELVDPRLEWHYVDSEMFRMIEAAAACVRHSAPKRPRMVQVVRALDSGDHLCDLSNGVKYGQSTVYDSGQYNEDIMKFRRMANGSFGDSEFDMYSTEYSSREMSGSQHKWIPCSSSGESESTVFNSHRSNAEHRS